MSADELPKWFSLEKFAAMPIEQRYSTWRNAKESDRPGATALVEAIESSRIDYTPPGQLTRDDPRCVRMYDIINEGREKCIGAVAEGLPALAGVERDLQAGLGADYRGENGATNWAGFFVAEMIRSCGYVDAGQRNMPPGSTAKSARFFEPRTRKT